jgi:hypothetical protein
MFKNLLFEENNFNDIFKKLISIQSDNMLDRTKCSTTARNIYNFITDQEVGQNNNLSTMSSNINLLLEHIKENNNIAYYIHFNHITNDTSHYFIVIKWNNNITILQSAVFEFSLADWCFPDDYENELKDNYIKKCKKIDDNEEESYRRDIFKKFELSTITTYMKIVDQIKECEFSKCRILTIEEFENYFLEPLISLEGIWNMDNINDKINAYKKVFSCNLDYDKMIQIISVNENKNAELKWISSSLQ